MSARRWNSWDGYCCSSEPHRGHRCCSRSQAARRCVPMADDPLACCGPLAIQNRDSRVYRCRTLGVRDRGRKRFLAPPTHGCYCPSAVSRCSSLCPPSDSSLSSPRADGFAKAHAAVRSFRNCSGRNCSANSQRAHWHSQLRSLRCEKTGQQRVRCCAPGLRLPELCEPSRCDSARLPRAVRHGHFRSSCPKSCAAWA